MDGSVLVGEAQLLADAAVPQLGEGLGHLDADAVEHQVVLVAVGLEQLGGALGDPLAHGDDHERHVVDVGRLDRAEEVGDAQVRLAGAAREREAGDLAVAGLVGPDHQVGAVAVAGVVAVDHLGDQEVVGAGLGQLLAQVGAQALLELVVGLAVFGAEAPLVAEQRRLVEVGGDVVERDALDHAAAGERRHVDRVVGLDLGGAIGQLDVGRLVALLDAGAGAAPWSRRDDAPVGVVGARGPGGSRRGGP